jgi:hypothetical protein
MVRKFLKGVQVLVALVYLRLAVAILLEHKQVEILPG